jgi:t-SNARE complex subunit (syntaxin)
LAERDEKKVGRWEGYAAAIMNRRIVTPKDVDEKIDERLGSHKFRILESLMHILESVEITTLSADVEKARKELRKHETELHRELIDMLNELSAKLEKRGESWDTKLESLKEQMKLVEKNKDNLEDLTLLRDRKVRDFISRLGDEEHKPDE